MCATYRHIRFPQGRKKALTLSYDDGVEQDIQLLEIMKKYGLKGTFNLNSGLFAADGTMYPDGQIYRRMTATQAYELYTGSGNEIAMHTLTHPRLETLTSDNVVYEIIADRKNLETMFDHEVRGGAYPYGTYSDAVVEALRLCGILYCRTVESTEKFALPSDWLRLQPTCHHNNPHLFELTDTFLGRNNGEEAWLFYLWGHSYEFEYDNSWNRIETFAERIGGRDDIWYATNIEIYNYIEAFHSLRFTTDGKRVSNPTATDVWFAAGDKEVFVPSGQYVLVRE